MWYNACINNKVRKVLERGDIMTKGFIFYKEGKLPFVIENYRMEIFTDDPLLDDFCIEHNRKHDYILHGQCFDSGYKGRQALFLVEYSMGSTCYLRCYIINMWDKDEEFDAIGLQSPFLDDIFRYEYEYSDSDEKPNTNEPNKEHINLTDPHQYRGFNARSRINLLHDFR